MNIARGIFRTFGWGGAYVFWGGLGLSWRCVLFFIKKTAAPGAIFSSIFLLISVFCSLLSSLGPILVDQNFGGLVGKGIIGFLAVTFWALGRAVFILRPSWPAFHSGA